MTKKSPYGNSIKDFEVVEKIGHGGFAEVFKAKCLLPGYENDFVAIKKINKKHVDERRCRDKIEKEIDIHSHLPCHPAFVKYYTSFEDAKYWYLVLELCAGGSFENYLKHKHRLSEKEAAVFIEQVIDGVQCLHMNLIIHRDLSLRNLLLTDKNKVKIADFGLALKLNHHDDKTNTVLGTANFMSPEVVNHDSYDFKADCWSVGCVLYALLYGAPPFNDKKRECIMKGVVNSQLVFPDYASSEAKELLMDMLNKSQKQRIELKSAMKYAFFQKFRKSNKMHEINYQKSGDSGMSSLSNSGSMHSQLIQETSRAYNAGSNWSQKERKNGYLKSSVADKFPNGNAYGVTKLRDQYDYNAEVQRPKYSSFSMQNSQNSPGSVNQMKRSIQKFSSQLESQFDVSAKNCPESPPYPIALQSLTGRNFSTNIFCSNHNSADSLKSSKRRSNSKLQSGIHRQNSCITTNTFQDNALMYSSCSHDQYCNPSSNCIHKLSCFCRCNRNAPCHSFENCASEIKNCVEVKNPAVEKCLKDIVTPLNTSRISSRRKEIEKKDVVVSILSDGQVSLEYLKLRKSKKYVNLVYYISHDGLEISVYRPQKKILLDSTKPPPLPCMEQEMQYFTFENLLNTHWKKYQFAKYFVDKVRGITPKVIIHGKHATCIMMENWPNPNYEMNFYNGFQIIEVGHKTTIKDKNGCVVKKDYNIEFMLKEFADMKEKCNMLEKNIETFHDSNFPVTLGRKPDVNKRNGDKAVNKENVTPNGITSVNGTVPSVKSHDIILNIDSSPYQSSFQRNTSTPQLSEKNVADILPQLKNLEVKKEWIIAEYKDGIQMCISMQDDKIFFYDTLAKTRLLSDEYPHLMNRFESDSRYILRCTLLKEIRNKM